MPRKGSLLLLSVFLMASVAMAQQDSDGIAQGFLIKPKPGMAQKFEEAYKAHVEWHRQQGDDWTWDTWQFETGEQIGQYIVRTGGHSWEDFDAKSEFREKDGDHYTANVAQYVESITGWFTRSRYDLSRLPEDDAGPFPLITVTEYRLNPGKGGDFNYVMGKVAEAAKTTNRPGYYVVVQGAMGTNGPTRSIVGLEKNWAGFKPGEKSIREMMEEVYGLSESDSLRETFWKSVHSYQTNVLRYRADLSYQPPTT